MQLKNHVIQITSCYPPYIGGTEIFVKNISERLAAKGHLVDVYTSDLQNGTGNRMRKTANISNPNIYYLKSYSLAHTPIIPSLIFKLFTVPKTAIIHLHASRSFVPEIVWIVSKIRNMPYVVNLHVDLVASGKFGFILPVYKRLFLKSVLRSACRVIVGTNDYRNLVHTKYHIPYTKITVIPCGVEIKPQVHRKRIISDLLFVGRLSKQKNIPLLIHAFKKVLDKKYNVRLHIVGSGEEKENLIKIINDYGLNKQIIMHGGLSWEKVQKLYSMYDLFILPSIEEAFGMVLIEAMAYGLPIIASDIPGLRNVIENGKTGLLVKPSVDNFALGIEKMIRNPDLSNKFINNGFNEVKKYDWNVIISQIEHLYREVWYEV
jgi:glycosyltransferase involved in cell wall biosynthesis